MIIIIYFYYNYYYTYTVLKDLIIVKRICYNPICSHSLQITKHEVKGLSMARSFFFFFGVLIDQDEVEVNKNSKTNKVNIHLS